MDFESFPKIPRLNRDIVITEKIDGTNAAVLISELTDPDGYDDVIDNDEGFFIVQAQSRNRLITPNSEANKNADNHGFAAWVYDNATDLVRLLGPGRHFGEWWGQGVARNYGLDHKRFSLFNPARYSELNGPHELFHPPVGAAKRAVLDVVPVLYEGPFRPLEDEPDPIAEALWQLKWTGSAAAPGFRNPEGIIVYHTAARQSFKVTLENDEAPKGLVKS